MKVGNLVRHYDIVGIVVDADPYGDGRPYSEIYWTDPDEPGGGVCVVWENCDFVVEGEL